MLPYVVRGLADIINLRILKGGDYSEFSEGPNVITRVQVRGRQEGQGQRADTGQWQWKLQGCALKTEGATSQGMQNVPRSWKRYFYPKRTNL